MPGIQLVSELLHHALGVAHEDVLQDTNLAIVVEREVDVLRATARSGSRCAARPVSTSR